MKTSKKYVTNPSSNQTSDKQLSWLQSIRQNTTAKFTQPIAEGEATGNKSKFTFP
jgi:hypothetical protein